MRFCHEYPSRSLVIQTTFDPHGLAVASHGQAVGRPAEEGRVAVSTGLANRKVVRPLPPESRRPVCCSALFRGFRPVGLNHSSELRRHIAFMNNHKRPQSSALSHASAF